MRFFPALLLVVLAACSPPGPSSEDSASPLIELPAPPSPDAALLAAPQQTGQWVFNADAGIFSASFGAPESEFQFIVSCEQPTRKLSIMSAHELAPDQDTSLSLIFDASMLSVPARSYNEGLPHVAAEIDGGAEVGRSLVSLLSEQRSHFGVRAGAGEVHVYPWDANLSRALSACR